MSPGTFVRPSVWLRRWWPLLLLGAVMLFFVAFLSLDVWIQLAARDNGTAAMRQFPGDGIDALMALVQSEQHTLKDRNRAVWALGQLRDRRALPVLLTYYTGGPCDHNRYLCQRELKKAIALCRHDNFDPWRYITPEAIRR